MYTHILSIIQRLTAASPLSPLAVGLALALTGCAVTTPPATTSAADSTVPREQRWSRPVAVKPPASEQDKLDEQAVLQRVLARQTALAAGRWEEAWSYLSPGTRVVMTPEQVRQDYERAVFVFEKAGTIECRNRVCDAPIQLAGKIALPRLGVRQTPVIVFERWEVIDGAPYLVPKSSVPR